MHRKLQWLHMGPVEAEQMYENLMKTFRKLTLLQMAHSMTSYVDSTKDSLHSKYHMLSPYTRKLFHLHP
jgi:hypothetical protein